ncbi:MAG: cytochrome C [Methylococcales bacterium]|nr:cytochrome C [Methylococcales bacterium]
MQYAVKRSNNLNYVLALLLTVASVMVLTTPTAQALPSFSRQTGQACSVCHTQAYGPNLTPLGRDFKLNGYTAGGGSGIAAKMPALSATVTGSFTNTQADQAPGTLLPGYNKNNNFTFDEASLFYAGRIYGKVGAYSHIDYDGYADQLSLGGSDVRFADQLEMFDMPVTYGISLNNNPTVQDLWNSTPAWGYPYTGNSIEPLPGAATLIDGGLSHLVGGATAYTMINNLLYLEAGAYGSFSGNAQNAFGITGSSQLTVGSPAPYWRVALQQDWQGHYLSVGQYGMIADISLPGRVTSSGMDKYTDVGVDATYQYMGNTRHIFEAKTTYIYEDQNLSASRLTGGVNSSGNTYLTTFRFNATYTFEQTYGINLAYYKTTGSTDAALYSGNAIARPNSESYTVELDYVPFGKSHEYAYLMNLRTYLQYIAYTQFNGASAGAQDNNTFMVNSALAF